MRNFLDKLHVPTEEWSIYLLDNTVQGKGRGVKFTCIKSGQERIYLIFIYTKSTIYYCTTAF